jgi:hypothetical protein
MPRKSPKSIVINANVRCLRIYPVEGSAKVSSQLKTIGFLLSKAQAVDLARVLLAVAQDWDRVELTGYRLEKRKSDDTFHITVTRPHSD